MTSYSLVALGHMMPRFYTSGTGTFTFPLEANGAVITMLGGGGGGGGGFLSTNNTFTSGGGGEAGYYSEYTLMKPVDPNETYTYSVGAGGYGGPMKYVVDITGAGLPGQETFIKNAGNTTVSSAKGGVGGAYRYDQNNINGTGPIAGQSYIVYSGISISNNISGIQTNFDGLGDGGDGFIGDVFPNVGKPGKSGFISITFF